MSEATQALLDTIKVTHHMGADGRCLQCQQPREDLKARGEKMMEAR